MEHAVAAYGVTKRYKVRHALRSVNLAIPTGSVHGLLGPNGAGKTTLLRVLLGLIRADAGRVQLFGSPVPPLARTLPEGVAGFVETPRFYPYLSGRRNLLLLSGLDRRGRVDDTIVSTVLDQVGLMDAADTATGDYSSGMRQRLGLAAMLIRTPRLLLLDEPTSSLDPPGAAAIQAMIRRLGDAGVTIVLSSHDMSEVAALCRSVTFLREGRVVFDGSVDAMRALAPDRIHVLHTSDDDAARRLAAVHDRVSVMRNRDGDGFELMADTQALDGYVVDLGRAGIAIRRLEGKTQSLEDIFMQLAGAS